MLCSRINRKATQQYSPIAQNARRCCKCANLPTVRQNLWETVPLAQFEGKFIYFSIAWFQKWEENRGQQSGFISNIAPVCSVSLYLESKIN